MSTTSATEKSRLSPEDWIRAGLRALRAQGPQALRAEPLARFIGLSKGSFYWHFEDVPAFHTALLAQWEADIAAQNARAIAAETTQTTRLRALCQIIATGLPDHSGNAVAAASEPSIRSWAHSSPAARAAIARLDAQRLTQIQGYLADLGIKNPEIARILLSASIGMADMAETRAGENAGAIGSLVDLVLALR